VALPWTGQELRGTCAKLRVALEQGKTHEEIAEEMALPWADFLELLSKFYALDAEDIRGKTTEQVYTDYVLAQGRNIRDLTLIIGEYRGEKNANALVGAIRARSDIFDKIFERGQELGFIAKRPETKLVAGLVVHQLSDAELRDKIVGELGALENLMGKYGTSDGKALDAVPGIIDVSTGPIHRPAPKQKALPEEVDPKPARGGAKNKVHGGRRVVKE
jgi:hypothetical protein